jgi:hypothetical protein
VTGWIIAACVVAYLVAYFWVGWALARRDLPNAWQRARKEYAGLEYSTRSSVMEQTVAMALFWPLAIPIRRAHGFVTNAVEQGDPKVQAAKIAEQQAYIRQLERELGIGRGEVTR